MPFIKKCVGCGEEFEAAWSGRVMCSLSCRGRTAGIASRLAVITCTACGNDMKRESPRQKVCRTCTPAKVDQHRYRRYGVTEPQWREMLAKFDGKCWLCKERSAEAVDHCHDTKRVRGALCRVCNMVLHYVERPGWWADAKAYLNGGDDHCGQVP